MRRSFLYLNYLKVFFENSKEIINIIILNNEIYYLYLKENLNNVINIIKLEYDLYCELINNLFKKLNELLNKKFFDVSDLFNLVIIYGFLIEIV